MNDDCIERTRQLLKKELDGRKQELVNKIEEYEKAREAFSELLSDSSWRNYFKKKFLKRKVMGLKKEIPALEETIEHYKEGITDLEQGRHGSVIWLLEKLEFIACLGSVRTTKCREISELIREFTALNS